MMGHWKYMCDNNHVWGFYRDMDADKRPEDGICGKCGEQAVTLQRHRMIKRNEIVIRDVGEIIDEPTSRTLYGGMYSISLRNWDGEIVAKSPKLMTMEGALIVIAKIGRMSDEQAEEYLRNGT